MSNRQKSDLEVCYAATVATTATDLVENGQSVAKVAGVATVAGGGFEFSNVVPFGLFRLWNANKADCRSYLSVMSDARLGRIPGVCTSPNLFGCVTNHHCALSAMLKGMQH